MFSHEHFRFVIVFQLSVFIGWKRKRRNCTPPHRKLYPPIFNCFWIPPYWTSLRRYKTWNCCWTTCTFGCNPLFPALMKLRALFVYLKEKLPNLWRDNNIESTDDRMNENPLNDLSKLLEFSKRAVLAEAALESAAQFMIQLYALAVQQHSMSIVQMVSLPVSFLSLAWASTARGGGGYLHILPIRVCAAQRGHDFEAPDLERGIHFRGVF